MTTALAEEVRRAHSQNEARIAAEIGTQKSEYDTEAQLYIRHFAEFCKGRGVPGLPARPATVAAFVRYQHAAGVPAEGIIAALNAIEAVHSDHNLASPTATTAVRTELSRILKIEPPRSWNKQEKLFFTQLPPEVKAAIARMEHEREKVIRRYQNEMAACRKCKQKESENHA